MMPSCRFRYPMECHDSRSFATSGARLRGSRAASTRDLPGPFRNPGSDPGEGVRHCDQACRAAARSSAVSDPRRSICPSGRPRVRGSTPPRRCLKSRTGIAALPVSRARLGRRCCRARIGPVPQPGLARLVVCPNAAQCPTPAPDSKATVILPGPPAAASRIVHSGTSVSRPALGAAGTTVHCRGATAEHAHDRMRGRQAGPGFGVA